MIIIWRTEQTQTLYLEYKYIHKQIEDPDEPHPYPERSSPTTLSTSGHSSYKGRSCIVFKVGTERVLCDRDVHILYLNKIRQKPDFKQLKVLKSLVQNGSGSTIGRDQAVNHV
jgi:hypothetical protein